MRIVPTGQEFRRTALLAFASLFGMLLFGYLALTSATWAWIVAATAIVVVAMRTQTLRSVAKRLIRSGYLRSYQWVRANMVILCAMSLIAASTGLLLEVESR